MNATVGEYAFRRLNARSLCSFGVIVCTAGFCFLCAKVSLPAHQIKSLILALMVLIFSHRNWFYGVLSAGLGLLALILFDTAPRYSILISDPTQRIVIEVHVVVLMTIIAFEAWHQSKSNSRIEQQRTSLREVLSLAVELKQFALHYQPIVDANTGTVVAMEALLRWNDPRFAHVAPDVFLPIVEEIGSTVDLERWIIKSACEEASTWPEEIGIHVNISPQHVTHSLLGTVKENLFQTSLSASRLTLEIIETSVLQNAPSTKSVMEALRELGVSFALDDFGAGFASLQYLLQFPFNKVKLDRSFVRDLLQKPQNRIIVRYVLAMAREMDLTVTAEGVETEDQKLWLTMEGVNQMQGYLFGASTSPNELTFENNVSENVRYDAPCETIP